MQHKVKGSGLDKTLFALVDCNNFYASCERVFNPKLEGKPIIVLSNNDGCIIARSNEAKKIGIPMAAPFFKWEKTCATHHVSVFSSNYELYGDMSRRIMKLLAEDCKKMEIYSIDEAFLRFQLDAEHTFERAIALKKKIKMCTGIPVSVGIAQTKTLAKLANYLAKNSNSTGAYYLNASDNDILRDIPVIKIWGIGNQLANKLHDLRIYTVQDLKTADLNLLRKLFGVTMEKTIRELCGTSCISLESPHIRKQIITSRSFGNPITAINDLEEAVSHYTAIACSKLRQQNSNASGIGVFLNTNQFRKQDAQYENSIYFPFPTPSNDTAYIIRIAKQCIRQLYQAGYKYQKAGVYLLNLIPDSIQQIDLFTVSPQKIDLMKTIDTINHLHGKNTVFYCAEGIQRSWQLKSTKRSPRYTTNWKELLQVR